MIFHNSTLLYGRTGSTKTSQAGRFARYVYEVTGKRTRMIAADYGGFQPLIHLVRQVWTGSAGWEELNPDGIIDLLDVRHSEFPASLITRLAEGKWLGDATQDPKTGGLKHMLDPAGEKTWEEVGGYIIESIESLGDDFLAKLRTSGTQLSQKPAFAYSETDQWGTQNYFGSNESQYGLAQTQVWDVIKAFARLPVRMLWTSRESVTEEETTKAQVIAPSAPGNKLGPKLPPMMGECLHAEVATVDKARQVRLWFEPHMHQLTQRQYDAKSRVPPEKFPELRAGFGDTGYVTATTEKGLDEFLRVQDELMAKAGGELAEWKKRVRSEAKS